MTTASSPNWIKRNPLVAYFVLAFVITWLLISPLVLSNQGWISLRISPYWHPVAGLGPLLGAFIVTWAVSGGEGIRALLGRMSNWRIGNLWFFLGVFSPFVLFGVAIVLVRLMGGSWPEFGKLAQGEYATASWILGYLVSAVAMGIGEETGWRGFALPRLQQGRSALSATLILTLFWGLWHIPFFFYRLEFGPVQVIGFFVGLLAGAIWFTCLYNSTSGSVFAVIAWHTTWNLVNQLATAVSVAVLSWMSVLVWLTAIAIVVRWGARLSPRANTAQGG